MDTERSLVDSHLRNMKAEQSHALKVETEKELYTTVEEENGIVITSTDYSKGRSDNPELTDNSKGFIKKPYVKRGYR